MDTVVRLLGVTQRYRNGFRFGPLNLSLRPGIVAVLGQNGAGKSTLMQILATVTTPSAGRLEVAGHPAEGRRGRREIRRRVGYLPQEFALPGFVRCQDYLTHVAWLKDVPAEERAEAVTAALKAVDLQKRAGDRIGQLSGGMRRRLGIAQALVNRPALLLLDEPTAGLDAGQRIRVRDCVRAVATSGVCVVLATHLVEDVGYLADRVLMLEEGELAFDGSVEELRARSRGGVPGDSELERAVSAVLTGAGR
ncbi:MAG: ABC transporter ATP-binding protein [Actinomadura sp.]